MPGYTSYSIDYEKIEQEQSGAVEKADRYFSEFIKKNPDGFFEPENNSEGTSKSIQTIQDIRYRNNLKACLLYLYDKNKRKLSVISARQINVTLFRLLNDLKNNTCSVSAEEIQQLFEKSLEARYYLVLFKNALNPFLEEHVFIAELKRRQEKTGWLRKEESIARLITALETNTEIRLKDRNVLMSEGKTKHVITFFEDSMPGNVDDVLSVTSENEYDFSDDCHSDELSEREDIDTRNFHHRSSIDFDNDIGNISERTTEEDNSDSSDDEEYARKSIGNARSVLFADDSQKEAVPDLVLESAVLRSRIHSNDEFIPETPENNATVDVNRLSALAYCYKKLRPRSSLFPLSPMAKKTGQVEKLAWMYCVDVLSCNGKQAIISPFLERCEKQNIASYHVLDVFNNSAKLGFYAKTIEAAAVTSDVTFNAEMQRYKSNPDAYKAQWKEKAIASNRQVSKSL